MNTVENQFYDEYVRNFNKARLDHLEYLNLPFSNNSVLELGPGPGILSDFFEIKGINNIMALEARTECIDYYRRNHPSFNIMKFDLENDDWNTVPNMNICFCYGILYHLSNPLKLIDNVSNKIDKFFIIDTVVSDDTVLSDVNLVNEDSRVFVQSATGVGCRPKREFIWNYLKKKFPYVYTPLTQPDHEDYVLDFSKKQVGTCRFVVIASYIEIVSDKLVDKLHNNYVKTSGSLLNILKKNMFKFSGDNKISIPSNIKHIKFDIGLSYSAPISQTWLKNEEDLLVFGFEPNPRSIQSILSTNNKKRNNGHGDLLEHKYINTNFFLAPIALSNEQKESLPFYITNIDEGCSSLYKPSNIRFSTETVVDVPVFTLKDFFDLLPLDKIPYIEYIKIDAQGADLEILMGAGKYLSEKVVLITAESEVGNNYLDIKYTKEDLIQYMNSIGFTQINHPNTDDPTFVNNKFTKEAVNIYIYQRG
jgi:FkbM family methyltransferase